MNTRRKRNQSTYIPTVSSCELNNETFDKGLIPLVSVNLHWQTSNHWQKTVGKLQCISKKVSVNFKTIGEKLSVNYLSAVGKLENPICYLQTVYTQVLHSFSKTY